MTRRDGFALFFQLNIQLLFFKNNLSLCIFSNMNTMYLDMDMDMDIQIYRIRVCIFHSGCSFAFSALLIRDSKLLSLTKLLSG